MRPTPLAYDVELASGTTRTRDVKGGFANAKEALEARAEVLREFKTGNRSLEPKMAVGEWLPRWLAARIERGELRESTATDYRDSIVRYLVPRLGHLRLSELRAAHLTAAYDALRRDRAAEIKAAEEVNVQRRAEAAAKNKVKHSGRAQSAAPGQGAETPWAVDDAPDPQHAVRGAEERYETRADPAQPGAGCGAAEGGPAEGEGLDGRAARRVPGRDRGASALPLYHLAAFAGMRRGELCGISWDDVDLDTGRIVVRWQITDQSY